MDGKHGRAHVVKKGNQFPPRRIRVGLPMTPRGE